MTPRELAEWSFFKHTAYCHGVFDNEKFTREPLHYHAARANEFLKFAEVVTVDIDSKDFHKEPHNKHADEYIAKAQLAALLENEFVRRYCFLITPSSGNRTPDKPNWHLSFKLNKRITSPEEYRAIALAVAAQIGVPTDHQTCKAAQPTFGTYFKDQERHASGYHWDDIYVNDEAEEVDPESVSRIVPSEHVDDAIDWASKRAQRALNYQQTESGNARVERHMKQPMDKRESLVLECLSYVLPTCNRETTYDQWMQIWMSAHHGAPTDKVRDYILNHPAPVWSDGNNGKKKFYVGWDTHVHTENGFTVASLIYLAMRAGWLDRTGYEIDEFLAEKIDVQHISDWLDVQTDIPDRLVLESQTGSGKTETLIKLWHRLDKPKTVVFVPTVKLATELAGKLSKAGLPTTLYIEADTGKRLGYEELIEADVLVTTLQTFGIKAFRAGGIMKNYGLVYVEESDQLISQFARGGGSTLYQGSHVTEEQARKGFEVLKEALEDSGYVWFVDATMTQVTYKLAEALSVRSVRYVLNERVRPKQTVRMLSEVSEAYRVILDYLVKGKRVVVACDKRDRAREVVDVMRELDVLKGKEWLLITKDTEHEAPVKAFMEDVEAGAAKYDLVVYNSVMASGVSIKGTRPDVLVQFCEYLTPRANLQILNRYRLQKTVFCYYADSESLYKRSADEIYERAGHKADIESQVVFVPIVERSELTKLREALASISASDDEFQRRAAREFYARLLHKDGRKVIDTEAEPSAVPIEHTLKAIRAAQKEKREYLLDHWHEVDPIDVDHPAAPTLTALEVACGRMHAKIKDMLNGVIPDGIDKRLIADICTQFDGKEFYLGALAQQEKAITRAEQYLADRSKAITAVATNATLIATLMTVRQLFERLDEAIPDEVLQERAPKFLKELALYKPHYDTLFERGQYKYDAMVEKYPEIPDRAIAFARIVFAKVGLRIKIEQVDRVGGKRRRQYRIENLDEAEKFLTWKYRQKEGEQPITLRSAWSGEVFDEQVQRNAEAMSLLSTLNAEQRERVLRLISSEIGDNRFSDLVKASQDRSMM